MKKQEEYWDSVAGQKEFTTPFYKNIFCKNVDLNSKILDVGCGYGRTLGELYKIGYRNLTGIDFSKEMINRGEELYPEINFMHMKSREIPFENDSFDSIILFAVLTCITNDKEQIHLIEEIKRVLKPEGIIYINDFLINTDERNIKRYNEFQNKYNNYGTFELEQGAVLRHHSDERVNEIRSHFTELHFEKHIYKTMNGHESNGFCFFGKN